MSSRTLSHDLSLTLGPLGQHLAEGPRSIPDNPLTADQLGDLIEAPCPIVKQELNVANRKLPNTATQLVRKVSPPFSLDNINKFMLGTRVSVNSVEIVLKRLKPVNFIVTASS